MKVYQLIMIVFGFLLFSGASCEDTNSSEQGFIIQNNSDQEIVVVYGDFYTENICFKPVTDFEYRDFIRDYCIRPHSNKNFSGRISNGILRKPLDTTYIFAYHRIDMDNMTCEEFKQKYPIKKVWKVTKADMDSMNWELSYP